MKTHPVKKYQLSDHYYFVMILRFFCRWDHYLYHKDTPLPKKKEDKEGGLWIKIQTNQEGETSKDQG